MCRSYRVSSDISVNAPVDRLHQSRVIAINDGSREAIVKGGH